MKVINREKITDKTILDLTDSTYVKGYFTNKTSINNNDDFLDVYRYVQFWKLPITDQLREFIRKENYAPKSIVENMRLTGEDSYFEELKLKNEEIEDIETEEELTEEIIIGSPQYARSGYEKGIIVDFDKITKDNASSFIHFIRVYEDIVNDRVICNFINKQLGGIAALFLGLANDIDYILDEHFYPTDYDSLELFLSFREISPELAYLFIHCNLSNIDNIDIAMIMKLAEYVDSSHYEELIIRILKTNNSLLQILFMKYVLSSTLTLNNIEEIILFTVRSRDAYVTFKIFICNEEDYEIVIDNSMIIHQNEEYETYEEE